MLLLIFAFLRVTYTKSELNPVYSSRRTNPVDNISKLVHAASTLREQTRPHAANPQRINKLPITQGANATCFGKQKGYCTNASIRLSVFPLIFTGDNITDTLSGDGFLRTDAGPRSGWKWLRVRIPSSRSVPPVSRWQMPIRLIMNH